MEHVNISWEIKEYLKDHRISMYTLAKMLNMTPSALYKSLDSLNLSVERVKTISQVLNHNFFIHFVENTGGKEEELVKLKTENRELSAKVLGLQKEVEYLKEINGLLKINRQ